MRFIIVIVSMSLISGCGFMSPLIAPLVRPTADEEIKIIAKETAERTQSSNVRETCMELAGVAQQREDKNKKDTTGIFDTVGGLAKDFGLPFGGILLAAASWLMKRKATDQLHTVVEGVEDAMGGIEDEKTRQVIKDRMKERAVAHGHYNQIKQVVKSIRNKKDKV